MKTESFLDRLTDPGCEPDGVSASVKALGQAISDAFSVLIAPWQKIGANETMKSEQGEDAMTIHEELEEMKREIGQTELYSKARGKLSAPALGLVERAYRELPTDEADAVRREILEALRS